MQPSSNDLVLRGGRVIDPAQGIDGIFDVSIRDNRIAAIGENLAGPARETIDVRGKLVLPGLIDTHAHVYRFVSGRFGLDADMVGVQSGVTTVVDQGGPSVLTFPGFREYAVKPAATRVLAFISAYMVGGLEGHYYPELYRPDCIAIDDTIRAARENADLVRGVKGHAEIGGFTRWGDEAMRRAAEISRSLDLPLYIHFGQLWPLPADKASYDADAILADLQDRGIAAVIPPKRNRKVQPIIDGHLYALRNLVERCFSKLKHSRRLATRYDKTADSYIGFVLVAALRLWVRHFVNRT